LPEERFENLSGYQIVPKPRIENKVALEEALDALRGAAGQALDQGKVVQLE